MEFRQWRRACVMVMAGMIAWGADVRAQEIMPIRVEGPRLSRSVFTNWDAIEVVFTLGYLDGYEPLLGQMKPYDMGFDPLVPDPLVGDVLEIRNQRQYQKERYVDVVYHLRYIGPKKEELKIPPQTFLFRSVDFKENVAQEALKAISPVFVLRYDSVLTEDMTDIKDEMDFGSFKQYEQYWKFGSLSVSFVLMFGMGVLIFRRPVLVVATRDEGEIVGHTNVRGRTMSPREVLLSASRELERAVSQRDASATRTALQSVCDAGYAVLRAYVPQGSRAMTVGEMGSSIERIEMPWLRTRLQNLARRVQQCEDMSYAGEDQGASLTLSAGSDYLSMVKELTVVSRDLGPMSVARRQQWFRFKKKFLFLGRMRGMRPWRRS